MENPVLSRGATFGGRVASRRQKHNRQRKDWRLMDKRWIRSLLLVLALLLACGSASLAFDDVDADEAGVAIMTLKDKKIVRGDGQTFGGERTLTWAEGIAMIVRGMGLTAEGEAGTAPPVTDRLLNV